MKRERKSRARTVSIAPRDISPPTEANRDKNEYTSSGTEHACILTGTPPFVSSSACTCSSRIHGSSCTCVCMVGVCVCVCVCDTPCHVFSSTKVHSNKTKKPYLGTCISISRRPIIQPPTIETSYSLGKSDHQKHKFLIIYSRTGKNLTSSHLTSIKKNKTLSPLISSYPRVTHTHTHTQKSKESPPPPLILCLQDFSML